MIKRRSVLTVVFALVAGLLPLGVAPVLAANPPGTGSIAGTVLDAGSTGVSGASVDIVAAATLTTAATVTTNPDGTWLAEGLEPGDYLAKVSWASIGTDWYPGVADPAAATAITVTADSATEGITFFQPSFGSLSGLITRNGVPAPFIWVQLYDSAGGYAGGTSTDADGRYVFGSLSIGNSYRVMAQFYTAVSYYGGPTLETATPVTIASRVTTGIDVVLPPDVLLSGTVTRGGTPLAGAGITIWNSTGMVIGTTTSLSDGTWIGSVLPGSYKVQASFEGSSRFRGGATDYFMASTFTVTGPDDPAASGLDIDLPVTGSISGTLTRNGAPLADSVQVFATSTTGMGMWMWSPVAPDGTWTITGLELGTYRIGTMLAGSMNTSYYVAGATATNDQMMATPVTVTQQAPSVTGVQFVLPMVGEISGRVTAGDTGVANTYVTAVQPGCFSGCATASGQTDTDGNYVLRNVPAGNYVVYTTGPTGMTQYFHGGTTAATATLLQLSAATPTFTGVDIQLPAGRIEGVLTYRGQPVPFANVSAQPLSGMGGYDMTDAEGRYSIIGLAPGDYAISAYSSMYGTVIYGGGQSWSPNVRVPITSVAPVQTGIDIAFGPGEVSGQVRRAGQPVAGAIVIASPGGVVPGSTATTDMNGNFTVRGIQGSTVKLAVRPDPMVMGGQPIWYGGSSEATATPITLAGDPPEATGIVFEVPTGRIDLTVTDAGMPVTQGYAVLVRADNAMQEVQQDSNSFDGWSFRDLAPGDYKIRFHGSTMFGCSCTWVGGSSFDTAQVITVGTGTESVSLELGRGTISGSIVFVGTPPSNGGQVMLFSGPETSPYSTVSIAYVNAGQTTFTMTGVPAGTYSLKFTSNGFPFLSMWAGGNSWANADRFVLTPGGSLTDVVIAPPNGSVSGRVTDAADQPIAGVSVQLYVDAPLGTNISFPPPVTTDADGRYTVPNVGPGTYYVLFSPPSGVNSIPEWSGGINAYGDTSSLATRYVLGDDEVLTGIDAQLDTGGRISGCITDTSGAPVPNVYVNAMTLSPQGYGLYIGPGTASGTDGCYDLVGLGSGDIQLNFAVSQDQMLPQFEYLLTEYWDGAYVWNEATLFPLALGQHVTGKNAVLEVGARGSVTNTEGGVPLAFGVAGAAFCKAPGVFTTNFTCSDGSGPIWTSATLGPLAPGTWNVRQVKGFFTSLQLGPVGSVTVGYGDVFHCTVPFESTPTCDVLVDDDGVPASVEADAPNSGDGNGDGVQDAAQPEVASLPDPTGGYVSVESVQDLPLTEVTVVDPVTLPDPPSNVDPQSGLVGFTVPDLPPAVTTVQIKVFLPQPADSYWKYDPVNGWVDASSIVTFSPDGRVATITLTDGAFGDQDGVVNGTIVDPGVFALTDRTQVPLEVALAGGSLDEGASLVVQPTITGAVGAVTTTWDLGADGSTDATAPTFTVDAGDGPRTVTVKVTVTDGDARSATATATFTVANLAPAAGTLTAPTRVAPNRDFVVSISGLADVPGDALSVAWDCGTGTFGSASAVQGSSATRTCRAPRTTGDRIVRVQITDGDGGTTVRTATVQVRRPTAPGAPTNLVGTPGDRRATLSWTAPADDGGARLLGYLVEFSTNGGRSWNEVDCSRCDDDISTQETTITITGLRRNTAVAFRVRAVNAIGVSVASNTVTVTPR